MLECLRLQPTDLFRKKSKLTATPDDELLQQKGQLIVFIINNQRVMERSIESLLEYIMPQVNEQHMLSSLVKIIRWSDDLYTNVKNLMASDFANHPDCQAEYKRLLKDAKESPDQEVVVSEADEQQQNDDTNEPSIPAVFDASRTNEKALM